MFLLTNDMVRNVVKVRDQELHWQCLTGIGTALERGLGGGRLAYSDTVLFTTTYRLCARAKRTAVQNLS